MNRKGISANKRTKLQRDVDIVFIIELLRRCKTHEAVKVEVNKSREGVYQLSRQQVSTDIGDAIQRLVENNSYDTMRARIVAAEQQLAIAMEALRCHGLSLIEAEKTVKELTQHGMSEKARSKAAKAIQRIRTEKKTTSGDKGYLAIASNAIAERCRLLGLYAQPPKGDEPPMPLGGPTYNQLNISVHVSDAKHRHDPDDIPLADVKELTHDPTSIGAETKERSTTGHGRAIVRTASATT